MHTRHTLIVVLVLAVTILASGARAQVSLGAGAAAGLARSLAGDPEHQQSAAVVTTLGTATAGLVGALSGVLVGHTQGQGVTGAAMGFAAGTLVARRREVPY